MGLYDISKATTLSATELSSLVVAGVGQEISDKIAEFRGNSQKVTAGVLIGVENGQIKGSKWVVVGNLGKAEVHTQRLGGDRGKMITIDLSDLSKFKFNSDTDPRNGANMSQWVDVKDLMTRMKTRDKVVTTDPKAMEQDSFIAGGGCSVRLTILPTGAGKACLWMSAAPGSPHSIKVKAQEKGLQETASTIPTVAVKLGSKAETSVKIGMTPAEGQSISKGWGAYPLLMVS